MSISLDIREWCDEADVDGNACDELRAIADRSERGDDGFGSTGVE